MSSSVKRQIILGQSVLLVLMFVCLTGCSEPSGKRRADAHTGRGKQAEKMDAELTSAHYFLDVRDIEKFRPGRSKGDILKDVQWRGNFLMAAAYEGQSVCAIAYDLFSKGPSSDGGEVVWAIFIDGKFSKFVPWQKGDMVDVPYQGTTWSRPRRIKVGDVDWLGRTTKIEPANIPELEKEANAKPAPAEKIDVGLTMAFILLKAAGYGITGATEQDYKRNAELRNQFNAARLEIGMTESEVESVLRAKPLESGSVAAGSFKIFGSNESFNIRYPIRFSNILVVFKDGKAGAIYSSDAGDGWRKELAWQFLDLPAQEGGDEKGNRTERKNAP